MSKTVKHDDFLSFLEAKHPNYHKRVTAHPDFDRTKHNSLRGVMQGLDPAKGDALSEADCNDILGSLFGAADQHGRDYADDMIFGEDRNNQNDDADIYDDAGNKVKAA